MILMINVYAMQWNATTKQIEWSASATTDEGHETYQSGAHTPRTVSTPTVIHAEIIEACKTSIEQIYNITIGPQDKRMVLGAALA